MFVGQDDDSGGGCNPRLSIETTTDKYLIVVSDLFQEGGGRYIVRVTDKPAPVLDESC